MLRWRGCGRRRLAAGFVVLGSTLAACAADSPPEIPLRADGTPDPVLVQGAALFQAQCSRCHGPTGAGGLGPRLADGGAKEKFASIADQIEFVRNGKKAMPAFGLTLDDSELEAVVRYTREVL